MSIIAPIPLRASRTMPIMGSTMVSPMMGTTVVSPMMGSTVAPVGMMGTGMMGTSMMGTGVMAPGMMGTGMMGTGIPIATTGLAGSTMMPIGGTVNPAIASNSDMGATIPVPSQFMSGTPPVVAANMSVPGGTPSMINQLVGTRRIPIIKRKYFTKNWFSCLDMAGFQT